MKMSEQIHNGKSEKIFSFVFQVGVALISQFT